MLQQPTARWLRCRFPYNQMIKINTRAGFEEDELSHVKQQMNKDFYCTSTDLENYFWQVAFFNTGCRICYVPRPANHSGWLATIAGFYFFYYLFIYLLNTIPKKKNQVEKEMCPEYQAKRCRDLDDNSPLLLSLFRDPQAPMPLLQIVPWALQAAAGP